jgi:hypothetical protein
MGLGITSIAAWILGYALVVGVPIAIAYAGKQQLLLTHPVVYAMSESGWVLMYGGGGTVLGCALVTFALGPVAAPVWVRWSALVAAIGAFGALAWFPFFLVYLWALVIGCWMLVAGRVPVAHPQPARA